VAQKLTKRRVDAAKPGETIWDGEIKGLALRVWASGARSYILKYRRGGVQRWFTIGLHGDGWTPEKAREEAEILKGKIRDGKDPAREKAENAEADTFAAFADRYLEDYSRAFKKPASANQDALNLRLHILPKLGAMKVHEITRSDVARLHLSMKGSPYSANRCRALLAHMFKKAEAWGLRPDGSNPTAHVDKYPEEARKRFLSPKELRRLGRVLAFLERKGAATYEIAAVRLLLFTGARLSEILTLRWEQVDTGARVLRLADSKTGAKTIALSAPALALLASIPRQKDNQNVICGAVAGAHLVNLHKPWGRIRKAALIPDVRIHDLRHSFASVAVAGGMSLPLIGSLLGHSQPATTARYAHLADDPRLAAADAVAATIAASLQGAGGEVIALRKLAR